jgi:hypothetical protein
LIIHYLDVSFKMDRVTGVHFQIHYAVALNNGIEDNFSISALVSVSKIPSNI